MNPETTQPPDINTLEYVQLLLSTEEGILTVITAAQGCIYRGKDVCPDTFNVVPVKHSGTGIWQAGLIPKEDKITTNCIFLYEADVGKIAIGLPHTGYTERGIWTCFPARD